MNSTIFFKVHIKTRKRKYCKFESQICNYDQNNCQPSPFLMSIPSWFSECVGVGGPPPILLLFADIVSGSSCDFTTIPSPS